MSCRVLELPDYRVTQTYAEHVENARITPGRTQGIDIRGVQAGKDKQCYITAFDSGVVVWAGELWGYGNFVWIYHGLINGRHLSSAYAHGKDGTVKVNIGDRVTKGQKLMYIGNTGNSTGWHLHFEMMDSKKELTVEAVQANAVHSDWWIDPTPFLTEAAVDVGKVTDTYIQTIAYGESGKNKAIIQCQRIRDEKFTCHVYQSGSIFRVVVSGSRNDLAAIKALGYPNAFIQGNPGTKIY